MRSPSVGDPQESYTPVPQMPPTRSRATGPVNEGALGLSPHSGWAVLVAVGGTSAQPQLLMRVRIEMADQDLQGSKQPYHEVEGLPIAEAERRLMGYRESAGAMAYAALRPVVESLRRTGYEPTAAGILESSGRKVTSLESILASHALIHTADGNHFREALAQACARCDLPVRRVRGRELLDQAAKTLRKPPQQLQASIQALGRSCGRPWDGDHKCAALLAWLLLGGKTKTLG